MHDCIADVPRAAPSSTAASATGCARSAGCARRDAARGSARARSTSDSPARSTTAGLSERSTSAMHAVGDEPVHLHVAVLPRPVDRLVDDRFAREVPEVVLDEPQQRIRDHVVVEVVCLAGRLDEGDLDASCRRRWSARRDLRARRAIRSDASRASATHTASVAGASDVIAVTSPPAPLTSRSGVSAVRVGGVQDQRRPVGDDDRLDAPENPSGVRLDRRQRLDSSTGRAGPARRTHATGTVLSMASPATIP